MAFIQKPSCDICGVLKQESNHWLIAFVRDDKPQSISFHPWNEVASKVDGAKHLCGAGCASKALSATAGEWR